MSKAATDWTDSEQSLDAASNHDADVDRFVRRHQDELLNFFHARLQQPQDAADLAQESCVRLLRYREGHSEASLRLLLFRIARNLLNDYWRWNRLHAAEEPTDLQTLELASEAPGQERLLESHRRLQQLETVVAGLPPKCRTVFLLSRIEGLRNAQVAQRCGISAKMVEKHIARALAACRRQVGDPAP